MKFNKLMSSVLCASMMISNLLPVVATQELTNDTLNTKQYTEVLYNKAATYFVSIPKTIVLDSNKTSNYSVKVSGDIPSDREVYVSPVDALSQIDGINFYMIDQSTINPKDNVEATVYPTKTNWNFEDVTNSVEVADNSINAKNLTSGTWKGVFDFEINLKSVSGITVSATDNNNNDLNASATNIEGEKKEQLLSSLVETGYITDVSEVDGLVNVESDDFDNIAHTTFDVSNLYEDGDTIAILHFDEEKQEWEYICADTVESGQISGDFTSYSPVAFVKVTSDGIYEQVGLTPGLYDANGVMLCTWEESGIDIEKNYNANSYSETSPKYVIQDNYPKTKTIVIPNYIEKIGNAAFFSAQSLENIILPRNLKEIGHYSFGYCFALKNIELPNNLVSINNYAFSDSGIISIKIPNSTIQIGACAFAYCEYLENIEVSESVISIGNSAFSECNSLANLTVSEKNPIYDSRNNCNAIIETSSNTLIAGGTNTVIPDDIITIKQHAFGGRTGLVNITIPKSVRNIESGAFMNCPNLTNISVTSGNTTYDSRNNCNAIIETSSNTLIVGCNTTVIPNTVIKIGNSAFNGNGLTSMTIPSSITKICPYAFDNCDNLTNVIFKDTSTWYVGNKEGDTTTKITTTSSSVFANYLKSTYTNKYWTKK